MRQARIKIPSGDGPGVYHCVSRVVDRRFIFGVTEMEMFLRFMREYEQFCGVRVLTYCLMSNHFHVLLEVPQRPKIMPDVEEIMNRLSRLSGAAISEEKARKMLAMFEAAKDPRGGAEYLEQFCNRMWDLSSFVKLLKQRFTQWFNRKSGRKGTLWEDRFKSILVEGEGDALMTMAAYIDLNPVRAGLVNDPAEYRWSGYGEAMAGRRGAKEGLREIMARASRATLTTATEALKAYRLRVFTQGEEGKEGTDEAGVYLRPGISRDAVLAVVNAKGRLPAIEYVRCRVRYFCDGAVIGSRKFVENAFGRFRSLFGERRKSGARRMRGLNEELYSARDLRVRVFE
ncbi:MAG: chemotaxis protein CheW [Pedosphaera sp.]|nr:chemotaxis protein CheW [Pedosphaera sp.]